MRYQPALQQISITPQGAPNGQVVLRLERLPDSSTTPEIDLLLLVGDRMSLSLGEYRVNLTSGNREFAAAPAGARLAGGPPPTSNVATPAPVVSGSATAVATAPAAAAAQPRQRIAGRGARGDRRLGARLEPAQCRCATSLPTRPTFPAAADAACRAAPGSSSAATASCRSRASRSRSIEPELVARGDKVIATFTQRYRGDSYSETSRKRLELVRAGNGWLIQQEEELQ